MSLDRKGSGSTPARTVARFILAAAMIFAGLSHLFWARTELLVQVPHWVPMDPDGVILASGVVEIALGVGLALLGRRRILVGRLLAAFFILVFPGNVAQYLNHADGFGLNSDTSRFVRLLFQPVLVAGALWATGIPRRRR
jgi:uncharacterized membrane protein